MKPLSRVGLFLRKSFRKAVSGKLQTGAAPGRHNFLHQSLGQFLKDDTN